MKVQHKSIFFFCMMSALVLCNAADNQIEEEEREAVQDVINSVTRNHFPQAGDDLPVSIPYRVARHLILQTVNLKADKDRLLHENCLLNLECSEVASKLKEAERKNRSLRIRLEWQKKRAEVLFYALLQTRETGVIGCGEYLQEEIDLDSCSIQKMESYLEYAVSNE